MIKRLLVLTIFAASSVGAAHAQPPSYKITPQQAFRPLETNVAGTTPQRVERGTTLQRRAADLAARLRNRRR